MFARASFARILALLVAVLFLWALFAGEGGAGGRERHYRVKAGDTLWSIAERTWAGDPRVGVWELREDYVDAELGMPADLDGVPGIDDDDHSGDYRILPVRVQVQWSGVSGTRTLAVETVLWNR